MFFTIVLRINMIDFPLMGAIGFDRKTYIRLRDISKIIPITDAEPIVRFGDVTNCDPEMSHVMAIEFQTLKAILEKFSLTNWQLLNILSNGALVDFSSQAVLMPNMDYLQTHHVRNPVPSVMRLVDRRSQTNIRMPAPAPRLSRGRGIRATSRTPIKFPTMPLH